MVTNMGLVVLGFGSSAVGEGEAVNNTTDEGGKPVVIYGRGAEEAVGSRTPLTAWLSGECFGSRLPVAVENAAEDARLVAADPVLAAGHTAFLGVPLSGPERGPTGVLAVYARRPRTWRPEEIDALLALAANASAALANAELYSRVSVEKERSGAILANVADGIVALDRERKVVLWHRTAGDYYAERGDFEAAEDEYASALAIADVATSDLVLDMV